MFNSKKTILKIDNPCHEDWDSMQLTEQARYCKSCKKEVIDFSAWSNQELINWFDSAKGNVCGRLTNTQLNYFKEEVQLRHRLIPRFILGIMLGLGIIHKAETKTPNYRFELEMKDINDIETNDSGKIFVEFEDSISKGEFISKKIFLTNNKNETISVFTDEDGYIEINESFVPKDSASISIFCNGYKEIKINDIYKTSKILLKESYIITPNNSIKNHNKIFFFDYETGQPLSNININLYLGDEDFCLQTIITDANGMTETDTFFHKNNDMIRIAFEDNKNDFETNSVNFKGSLANLNLYIKRKPKLIYYETMGMISY